MCTFEVGSPMFDDAGWHDDPTHLVRYVRWASDRGLLLCPLSGLSDAELLALELNEEDFTGEGAGFTQDRYASYLEAFERMEPPSEAEHWLDARLAEWRRGERLSGLPRKRPTQVEEWRAEWAATWKVGWALVGVGVLLGLMGFVVDNGFVAFAGLLVVGGVAIAAVLRPHLRR